LARTLTIAGVEVARIGLGTNRLRRDKADFLREAVDAGIGMIDSAHGYTGGESERTIGQASLDGTAVVASKGGYEDGSPEGIQAQIEESLERLRRKTIDLYYLHRPHSRPTIAESLGAIREYVDLGRIRAIGISQVTVDQIEEARQAVPIAAVQHHYNIEERRHDDVVDYCEREGIVFFPFFPLKGKAPKPLKEIARAHDATRHQIALAWLLRRSPVILPIPGTTSIEHARENLASLEIELTDDEFEALG
jgi:pyridoxine 4-dehydrogenase